jgi:hypothetical protein
LIFGQVLERLHEFEEANKQYCLTKTVLLANFVEISPLEYNYQYREHRYEYDQHRKFIDKNRLFSNPTLLVGSQKLQKDLNKMI